ncbi:GNAT family N-acetyltransferase [Scytonema sp. UIC 10036]|uniref:GNAT family N-acetyltransferase n=1 Tax=Scytonema sp. UIC 10036 TaxID=2304196 RepID=UPI0012DA34DD|nr:GNAT family N-acetyltransferase [Scytonema sp. UIC 10036]MUG94238.1 GNAT family N-acetyltransferase [Scytonema sp. UIC 10036]
MNRVVEEISLKAWPAFESINYHGWLMRFADGYTKRANSVTVLSHVDSDVEAKVTYCESQYQVRKQKPIFRLLSFTEPKLLDCKLAAKGYQLIDPSLVMGLAISGRVFNDVPALNQENLNYWLVAYHDLIALGEQPSAIHRKILTTIQSETLFVSLKQNDKIVACGLGVLERGYLGIFDLVTSPTQRRRGYATAIIQGLLQWAIDKGAFFSYIQVVKANTPARNLYEKLGYEPMYEYWYRVSYLR